MPVDRPTGGDRPHEIGDPERQLVADSQDVPRPFRDPLDSDAAKRLGEVRNAAADDPGDVEVRPSSPDRPPAPERQSTWWREHQDAEHADEQGAPFDPEQAARIPDYIEERGYRDKARGMLTGADGQPVWDDVLASGIEGPAKDVGADRLRIDERYAIVSHVEAHAAAEMRRQGLSEATLYVNRRPCPGPAGCEEWLPDMVPPAAELTVYGPNGYRRVVVGNPEDLR